jgi:repressor of nif and glnA expression
LACSSSFPEGVSAQNSSLSPSLSARELNHHIERKGYGIMEIDIAYRRRLGEKKLKLKHGLTIAKIVMLETTY